jgi:16S rRNA (cytidine1402-2'-O)-methyltransferase
MKGTPDDTRRPGTLFVVATPIGNLEDITLRALRVLREVALVAAEDTRRTGNLLRHYEIQTPLVSVHAHNERQRSALVIERLRSGDSVALATDAGTPGISDPGSQVVKAAREAGFRVDPIPGPSAVTAVLSASGLDFTRFAFAGFPPIKSKDRKSWLEWVDGLADVPVVCFEAPHRIERTLEEFAVRFGVRPIILARELTKTFEQWTFGPASTLKPSSEEGRGEFVLILCPVATANEAAEPPSDATIQELFGRITDVKASSRRAAIRLVAEELHLPLRHVFEALERQKKAGD